VEHPLEQRVEVELGRQRASGVEQAAEAVADLTLRVPSRARGMSLRPLLLPRQTPFASSGRGSGRGRMV
jgi:hypothetical protein